MRRRLPLLRTVLALSTTLVVAIAAVLLVARIDRVVVAPGSLAGGSSPVRTEQAGLVREVHVRVGDRVEEGQVLVTLEARGARSEGERVRARIQVLDERAQALRDESAALADEVHPGQLVRAERAVEKARLELEVAGRRLERLTKLGTSGLASALEIDEARLARDVAELTTEEARQDVARLPARQKIELDEIDSEGRAIDGRLREERASVAEIVQTIEESVVTASAAGIVIGEELDELEGRSVAAGETLFRMATAPASRFEGTLTDAGRSRAKTGLPVKIRLDGYPWRLHGTLAGTVVFIADRRDDRGGFLTRIDIDPTDAPGPLYEGMRGQARIILEEDVSLGRLLLEKLVEPDDS